MGNLYNEDLLKKRIEELEIFSPRLSFIFKKLYKYAKKDNGINPILDIGCGKGHVVEEIANYFNNNIDAIDIDSNEIEEAMQNSMHKNINYGSVQITGSEIRPNYV